MCSAYVLDSSSQSFSGGLFSARLWLLPSITISHLVTLSESQFQTASSQSDACPSTPWPYGRPMKSCCQQYGRNVLGAIFLPLPLGLSLQITRTLGFLCSPHHWPSPLLLLFPGAPSIHLLFSEPGSPLETVQAGMGRGTTPDHFVPLHCGPVLKLSVPS